MGIVSILLVVIYIHRQLILILMVVDFIPEVLWRIYLQDVLTKKD